MSFQCNECAASFNNENELGQHGRAHKPKDTLCPCCYESFSDYGAALLHIDSGGCRRMSRDELESIAISMDVGCKITKSPQEDDGDYPDDRALVYYRLPGDGGWGCDQCRWPFPNKRAVLSHLNSGVHSRRMFVCRKCPEARDFSHLSGLAQHVEYVKCQGTNRFSKLFYALRTGKRFAL